MRDDRIPFFAWHKDLREVSELGRWLIDTGRILTLSELQYFYERPEKWQPERVEFEKDEALDRIAEEHAALEDEAWGDMQRRASL